MQHPVSKIFRRFKVTQATPGMDNVTQYSTNQHDIVWGRLEISRAFPQYVGGNDTTNSSAVLLTACYAGKHNLPTGGANHKASWQKHGMLTAYTNIHAVITWPNIARPKQVMWWYKMVRAYGIVWQTCIHGFPERAAVQSDTRFGRPNTHIPN